MSSDASNDPGACWPPGMRSAAVRGVLREGRRKCTDVPQQLGGGSVVLSLTMPSREPLTMHELCGDVAVDGFFAAASDVQISSHGLPPYQRAKSILYLWAHMMFAHWHGYALVVAHSKGALPKEYTRQHGSRGCVHFVETQTTTIGGGSLFSLRYRNALAGMAAHRTKYVIHEDMDTDFGPAVMPPFFFNDAGRVRRPVLRRNPCPQGDLGKDTRCSTCVHGTPALFLSVSNRLHNDVEPGLVGRAWHERSVGGQVYSDLRGLTAETYEYLQSQMDQCFGHGTAHNVSVNVRRSVALWFSGQLSGEASAVRRILERTEELLRTAPAGLICDMAALTLTLRAMGLGDSEICDENGLSAAYVSQGAFNTLVGLRHSGQIEWLHLIYPLLIGRNVSLATYQPLYRERLFGAEHFEIAIASGWPLLSWRKHHSLRQLQEDVWRLKRKRGAHNGR